MGASQLWVKALAAAIVKTASEIARCRCSSYERGKATKRARATQSDCERAASHVTSLERFSVLADMSSRGKKKTSARSTA